MTKVLVVGCTGMLGSMVSDCLLRQDDVDVVLTARQPDRWQGKGSQRAVVEPLDAEANGAGDRLPAILERHAPEFIVNCLGVIKPYCKDTDQVGRLRAIRVNALFPYILQQEAAHVGARVVQIATDCVYSGTTGGYDENSPHDPLDVYGKTKSLGEVMAPNFLNIRCSVVGPERYNRFSLLEWFLGQPDGGEVSGFAHHRWNGVTALQFARLCHTIVAHGTAPYDALAGEGITHHFVPNETVSKYELLQIFAEVYGKRVTIKRVDDAGPAIDRSLGSRFHRLPGSGTGLPMDRVVREMRAYTDEIGFYDTSR